MLVDFRSQHSSKKAKWYLFCIKQENQMQYITLCYLLNGQHYPRNSIRKQVFFQTVMCRPVQNRQPPSTPLFKVFTIRDTHLAPEYAFLFPLCPCHFQITSCRLNFFIQDKKLLKVTSLQCQTPNCLWFKMSKLPRK